MLKNGGETFFTKSVVDFFVCAHRGPPSPVCCLAWRTVQLMCWADRAQRRLLGSCVEIQALRLDRYHSQKDCGHIEPVALWLKLVHALHFSHSAQLYWISLPLKLHVLNLKYNRDLP